MRKETKASQKSPETETTTISVDFENHPELLEVIDRERLDNDRSRAAQVRIMIRECAKEKGLLP